MLRHLTALESSAYPEGARKYRACLGPALDAERGVFVSGRITPECPTNREASAVLYDRSNTRAFFMPGHARTYRRCRMAQDTIDLADTLNEARCKIAFIGDVFTQDEVRTFRFSNDGATGFYFILRDIETMLKHVSDELLPTKGGQS